VANRKIAKDIGFNINFRYQQTFLWQSSYGVWNVPAYARGGCTAQLQDPRQDSDKNWRNQYLAVVDYRTNIGAPFIGQQYYISLTFDEFFEIVQTIH